MTDGSTPTPRRVPGLAQLLKIQQLRYLVVGGLNTALSYGLYVLFLWVLDAVDFRWDYIAATAASWLLSNITSFFLQRTFVFRAADAGLGLRDFARFTSVTLASFGANLALGAISVELLGFTGRTEKMISQLVITGVLVIVTYFLHRGFSFRRSTPVPDAPPVPGEG